MEPKQLLTFLHLAEKLKGVTRHAWTSNNTHEAVSSHSWRLALMAMCIKDEFKELDMDRVIQMCLIHDLGEAITSDIPAFLKTDADEQKEDESWKTIIDLLEGETKNLFISLLNEMNERKTKEAKLYKCLDRCEALIQHNEGDLSTWIDLEYELQFTYGKEDCEYFEYTKRLREAIDEESRLKIGGKL